MVGKLHTVEYLNAIFSDMVHIIRIVLKSISLFIGHVKMFFQDLNYLVSFLSLSNNADSFSKLKTKKINLDFNGDDFIRKTNF
jgi:hypothetical protein